MCVVDDAQWLDRASGRALAFVGPPPPRNEYRLRVRGSESRQRAQRIAELAVEPLGRRDARALLESVLPARVDDHVLDRIVRETHGNPLALMELPRGMTPIQLAGGFGLPAAASLSASIEESFARRLTRLPADARRLLLIAAADPTGDPAVIWRAGRELGISESVVDAVEAEDLLELGVRVVFDIHSPAQRSIGRPGRANAALCIEPWQKQPIL